MLRSPALILAALLAVACGTASDSDVPTTAANQTGAAATPEDITHAFFDAVRDDDRARFEELLTEKARAGFSADNGFQLESDSLDSYTVGAAQIDGESASVPVNARIDGTQQEMSIKLRRENARWRVFAFGMPLGGDQEITIDLESMGGFAEELASGIADELASSFEQAFEDWSAGGSEDDIARDRARFESLEGMALNEHDAAWQIALDGATRPALEVLTEIVAGTGLAIDPGVYADALSLPVAFEANAISRVEAIEHVAAAVGLYPIYPQPNAYGGAFAEAFAQGLASMAQELVPGAQDVDLTAENEYEQPSISFATGARPYPVAFSGPFLIEIDQLDENPPHATGSISIAARALGLAPGVLTFQAQMSEFVRIEAVVDARGENLNADEGVTFLGEPQIESSYIVGSANVDLKNLIRDVRSIDRFQGSIRLRLPTKVRTVRWKAEEHEPRELDDMTLSLVDWGTYTRFELVGAQHSADTEVWFSPSDASGQPMGKIMQDSSAWGDKIQASVQVAAPPATIELKVCAVAEVTYPFTLTHIELAHFAEMPEALEPLAFSGSAPVSVEFVRILERGDFPKVEVTVANSANKDVMSVVATFFYVDASGNELQDFMHTISGDYTMEGQQPLAIGGATKTLETTAFFMPPETHGLRVRVDQAEFPDASSWSRE